MGDQVTSQSLSKVAIQEIVQRPKAVCSGRSPRAREEQHRDQLVLEGSREGVPEPE